MSDRLKFLFPLVAAVAVAMLASSWTPLSAASKKNVRPNRISVEYTPAEKPEHREIEAILKKNRVLERVARIFSPIRLPRTLTVRVAPCDGDANAYYDDDEIKVCYEYMVLILQRTSGELPKGTTRRNLVIGAMADAFFHETGHAVFDMLEIPVFGREEDAADQFSAYVMLHFARADSPQLIAGAAFWFVQDMKESAPPGLEDYAGEHGLPAQRFFNYMCLAYGMDPKTYAAARRVGQLTEARAEWCEGEYKQVDRAFRRLIFPYVDRRLLAKIRATKWFNLDSVEGPIQPRE